MDDPLALRTPAAAGTIIAGRFDTFDQAGDARERLQTAGFPAPTITTFFNNPPGRHDQTEIGGDEFADPQAAHSGGGALAGAAAGAGIGIAAIAAGPFGVAALATAGAYVGALAGAMNATGHASEDWPERRPSGVIVAVQPGAPERESEAIDVLRTAGADHIERAVGTLVDGDWSDFDPVARPHLVDDPSEHPTIVRRSQEALR
ncbi:MAG: hypothetical protein ABI585_05030 [Betaproteobacteria bacterium]